MRNIKGHRGYTPSIWETIIVCSNSSQPIFGGAKVFIQICTDHCVDDFKMSKLKPPFILSAAFYTVVKIVFLSAEFT